jgi:hypothetical protein
MKSKNGLNNLKRNRIMEEVEFDDDYEGLNGNNIDYFNPWIN